MSTVELKKCEPLQCNRFKRYYDHTWMNFNADRIVMACPFRKSYYCMYREGQDLMIGLPKPKKR